MESWKRIRALKCDLSKTKQPMSQ
uniref:Uncharacterized protein n=1 Tax=Arundo donax TaxID=35708 RepID=A0A0A8Y1L7_ARUDO